jgi:hypothetical protein
MAAKDMSVVLAHGAWADGPSWAPVVTALKAEGMKVSAVPLPLTSLADDIAACPRSNSRRSRLLMEVSEAATEGSSLLTR